MQDRHYQALTIILAVLIVILGISVSILRTKETDINFTRHVFYGLISGSPSTHKLIAWEEFKALDMDVAEIYKSLKNDTERSDYERSFVKGFSFGFKKTGAKTSSFTNWRIYRSRPTEVIVACDYKKYNKTLLFTISKIGKPKLIGIHWEK